MNWGIILLRACPRIPQSNEGVGQLKLQLQLIWDTSVKRSSRTLDVSYLKDQVKQAWQALTLGKSQDLRWSWMYQPGNPFQSKEVQPTSDWRGRVTFLGKNQHLQWSWVYQPGNALRSKEVQPNSHTEGRAVRCTLKTSLSPCSLAFQQHTNWFFWATKKRKSALLFECIQEKRNILGFSACRLCAWLYLQKQQRINGKHNKNSWAFICVGIKVHLLSNYTEEERSPAALWSRRLLLTSYSSITIVVVGLFSLMCLFRCSFKASLTIYTERLCCHLTLWPALYITWQPAYWVRYVLFFVFLNVN